MLIAFCYIYKKMNNINFESFFWGVLFAYISDVLFSVIDLLQAKKWSLRKGDDKI